MKDNLNGAVCWGKVLSDKNDKTNFHSTEAVQSAFAFKNTKKKVPHGVLLKNVF